MSDVAPRPCSRFLTIRCVSEESSKDLDALLSANPRTKEDFQALSAQIIDLVIKRLQDKPLYPSFVEYHVRQLADPLKDVEVRKAASGLTILANEKQKEQRDKASGKKKPKSAMRPTLGAAKASSKYVLISLQRLSPSDRER